MIVTNIQFGQKQMKSLTQFLSDFEKAGFVAGQDSDLERNPDGSFNAYYVTYTARVLEFEQAAYKHKWVLPNFDWSEWIQTAEPKRLRDDPEALAKATPHQLAKLLTVLIRQDRFCEGALLDAFSSGLMLRIVRRIAALAQDAPPE